MTELAVFCFVQCVIVIFVAVVEDTAQVMGYAVFWCAMGNTFAGVGAWLAARRYGRAVGGRAA